MVQNTGFAPKAWTSLNAGVARSANLYATKSGRAREFATMDVAAASRAAVQTEARACRCARTLFSPVRADAAGLADVAR